MRENKKKEKTPLAESDPRFDKSLEEFAKLVAEELDEERRGVLEPFEAYTQRIKSKIHADLDQFRSRFSKGYYLLLEELKKDTPSKKEDDTPGPNDIKP